MGKQMKVLFIWEVEEEGGSWEHRGEEEEWHDGVHYLEEGEEWSVEQVGEDFAGGRWNVDCEPAACKHELEVWHDTWDWEDEDAEG